MKTNLFSRLLTFIFCFACLTSSAQETKHEHEYKFKKQKSYSKSYSISSSDKISLDNQFGEMKLITWDKNEIKVEVNISGSSDDEARAQQIIDRISIQDEMSNGSVSFKTKFENQKNDHNNNNKEHYSESMKIDFTAYLPATNPINVKNQFGSLIVPDYRGEATIESQFGSLSAGKISNAKNIKVAFGSATIAQVNNGKVDIQYSTGTVNKLAGDVDAKFQFSTVKIDVDNDVKSLDIDNSYTTLYVNLSKDFSAAYNISTSYGSFKNKSNFKIDGSNEEKRNYSMTSKYSGTSGSGNSKLNIRSSFGSVIAGHDLQVDMTKKKKSATI